MRLTMNGVTTNGITDESTTFGTSVVPGPLVALTADGVMEAKTPAIITPLSLFIPSYL